MFVAGGRQLADCAQMFRSALAVSPKDALQFAEFRRMIECSTARRAAERATPADVAELEAICERKDAGGTTEEGVHWDWLFHRKLAEIAGNEVVCNVMAVLQEFVVAGIRHTSRSGYDAVDARSLHEDIIRAIREHDADAAAEAMQAHMDALVDALHRAERREPKLKRRKARKCAV
jgi:GntR family transcriptional repressor for pyruvate dehydrogenase complex